MKSTPEALLIAGSAALLAACGGGAGAPPKSDPANGAVVERPQAEKVQRESGGGEAAPHDHGDH